MCYLITVAFDLDDTLYDRTQPLRKTLLDFDTTKELPFHEFNEIFQKNSVFAFDKVTEGTWTLEESYIYRVTETLKEFGIHITKNEAQKFQQQYYENQQKIELFPHIIEILDFLNEKNVQTIIITNGPSPQQRVKVENLGLNQYFTVEQVIVSGEEKTAKPDIQIFESAEARFNLDKTNTWYVGDSYTHDIIGATNAGWKTIWMNHRNQEIDFEADVLPTKTVKSSTELKDVIFDLFEHL